ncbi:hypothetical protein IJ098_01490 [Candidatus Saccharibacteria bacterium]|nr:hypothetical protein [Candidatus Saccharibacteria bacterium]
MKKIKSIVMAMTVALSMICSVVVAQSAFAVSCPAGSIREGENVNTLAECNVEPDKEGSGLMDVIYAIINTALAVLGIVTVGMIIIGGVQYTTSQGDPAKATKAKNTILYGVIGLIIALLAFAIVNFVLGEVFNGKDTVPDTTVTPTTNTANNTNTSTTN